MPTCSVQGLNLQKMLHLRNKHLPEKDRQSYYKHSLWRLGLGLVIFGSLADLAALVFAPQSLIAPLGGLTLVSNAIFAPLLLKERFTRRDTVGTALIVTGATIAVAFASHQDIVYDVFELFDFYTRTPFLVYAVCIFMYMLIVYVAIQRMELEEAIDPQSPYYKSIRPYHRFAYASISGTIGAQSVLFAKCSVELVVDSFEDRGFLFNHWQTYLVIGSMFTTIFLQIRWLNDGLKRFNATYIVPVFTAFWILLSITSGLVFYREYTGMMFQQGCLFALGVVVTISGVMTLSSRGFHSDRESELMLHDRDCDESDVLSEEEKSCLLGGDSWLRSSNNAEDVSTGVHTGVSSASRNIHDTTSRCNGDDGSGRNSKSDSSRIYIDKDTNWGQEAGMNPGTDTNVWEENSTPKNMHTGCKDTYIQSVEGLCSLACMEAEGEGSVGVDGCYRERDGLAAGVEITT